jgi:signal transduction histidine kinase
MPRFRSIISRIVSLHVVALAVAAIAMPLATYLLLDTTANEFENQTLRTHAQTLAAYLHVDSNGRWSLDLPQDLRTFYLHGFDGFAYTIVDASNKILFSSLRDQTQPLGGGNLADSPSYFHLRSGKAIYYGASFPIRHGNKTVRIQVGQDLEHPDVIVDDIVAGYLAHVAWFTIPIMLLLLLIDIVIVRRALVPVTRASDMARAIDPGRIDVRLPTADVPAEVIPLVLAVNQALDRLERGFRLQRDFSADAAHELRTPLAVLRARIDTLVDRKAAAELRTDLETMTHIVNQLLAVAELEADDANTMDVFDLHGVCSEVAAGLAPIAVAQKKDIALTGHSSPVLVRGNAPMLHRAIRNLAENALRHTPVGTTVEIIVEEGGSVSVSDEGPGVSATERELVFRRFWRRDRSHAGGAGLGLAIVARIVEAHAGAIKVQNRPSGGAIFSIELGALRTHP